MQIIQTYKNWQKKSPQPVGRSKDWPEEIFLVNKDFLSEKIHIKHC